ncbi:MAG: hypothetical protein QOH84_3659, partial [Kribbellaceae bacterium]|nr:hypothetical protein [Kribbellaceae bacterium]
MNATIRGLKGLLALGALAGLGLLLHWVTAGSIEAATAQDLTSMASLAIGAVAWIAYCWLVVAVLATVLEQLPGAVGRSASLVAGRITSQGSRALLRSALGVAAVTPLTIGVAHATPDHTLTHQSTTTPSTGTRPWTPAEPHSPLALRGVTPTTATSARPRTAVEPRSSIELRGSTPTAARLRTSVEPQSTVKVRATPTTSHHPTSPQAQPAHPRTTEPPTDSRPWNSLEPQSTVEVTDSTPTAPALPAASGNSVASDDSVASGNSVASSSSVASGHSVASASSVALRGSAYGSVESQSAHSRPSGTPASSRPWNSVEPRSTVELTGGDPTSGTLGAPGASGSGSTESQSAHPRTTGTPAGARPWSSVEPRSSVEITDGTPGDWRATEEPSSVQLGVPATPATPSQANPE